MKQCECGCGGYTKLATKTDSARGIFKGEYRRYLSYHKPRRSFREDWKEMGSEAEQKRLVDKVMREQGVSKHVFFNRLYRGWTKKQILTGVRWAKKPPKPPSEKAIANRERNIFIDKIVGKQDISRKKVYQRLYHGWTREEVSAGYRDRPKSQLYTYVEGLRPYNQSEYCDAFPDSDIIDNAQIRLGFLLFDTIKAMTKLDDIECYTLTAQINVGLRDRLQGG